MRKLVTLFAALLLTVGTFAQNIIPGGTETIKLKGFVSFITFMQDQSFKQVWLPKWVQNITRVDFSYGFTDKNIQGNQISVSALYKF